MKRRNLYIAGGLLAVLWVAPGHEAAFAEDVGARSFQQNDAHFKIDGGYTSPPPESRNGPGNTSSLFSLANSAMGEIAGSGNHAVTDRLTTFKKTTISARATTQPEGTSFGRQKDFPADGFTVSSVGGWTQVFGLDAAATLAKPFDSENPFSGATIGFDFMLSPSAIGGVFFGGSMGAVDDENTFDDVRANGFYAGVYLSRVVGDFFLDFTLGTGITDQDTSRIDPQTQKLKASYAGYFINPSFRISNYLSVFSLTVIPSVSVSYSGFFFDSYRETGVGGSLEVDGRQTHLVSTRSQIAVPFTHKFFDGSSFEIEGRTGFDARFDLSGDAVALTQNGAYSFDATGGEDRTLGVFLGIDTAYSFSNGVLLYGELEGLVTTTGDINAFAQFGTRFSF